ncbi:MAG: response regulator [Bacteroidales bacterium]|nr:response regulator [Bacteroidales bacterium]
MTTKKILIIDDDPDITRSLQVTLEDASYEVHTANNVTDGLEKLKTVFPDLLILDVMMESTFEGHSFAIRIKKEPEYINMPILVITGIMNQLGIDFKDAFDDYMAMPLVFYLDKPVDPEELLIRVAKLI